MLFRKRFAQTVGITVKSFPRGAPRFRQSCKYISIIQYSRAIVKRNRTGIVTFSESLRFDILGILRIFPKFAEDRPVGKHEGNAA